MKLEIMTNGFGFRQERYKTGLVFKSCPEETCFSVNYWNINRSSLSTGDTLFCLSSETTWLENDSFDEHFVSMLF